MHDLGDRVDRVRLQVLDVVHLGELAAVVRGAYCWNSRSVWSPRLLRSTRNRMRLRAGELDQPVADVAGGEGLAAAGRHLDQRARVVGGERALEVLDRLDLAAAQAGAPPAGGGAAAPTPRRRAPREGAASDPAGERGRAGGKAKPGRGGARDREEGGTGRRSRSRKGGGGSGRAEARGGGGSGARTSRESPGTRERAVRPRSDPRPAADEQKMNRRARGQREGGGSHRTAPPRPYGSAPRGAAAPNPPPPAGGRSGAARGPRACSWQRL